MINALPDDRPNCEEILEFQHLWSINEDEFGNEISIERNLHE
jgi:hypothetical protein